MPQNLVEKIVQSHAVDLSPGHVVRSGDFLTVRPRHVMTHDNTSAVIPKFVSIGARRIADQRQPVFILDHDVQNHSEENLSKYRKIEAFAAEHGLVASMSRKGNCYDNAHIESFWSSLKYEVVYHRSFATRGEAATAIFDYIETFYNRTRLHSSLGYKSPAAFESELN